MPKTEPTSGDLVRTLQDFERRIATAEALIGSPPGARGVIANQILMSSSTGYTASGATDFVLNDVVADGTRNYEVVLSAQVNFSGATGVILINLAVDTVQHRTMAAIDTSRVRFDVARPVIWKPATGVYDLAIHLNVLVAGGTATFSASSTPGSLQAREFSVRDIGPRT